MSYKRENETWEGVVPDENHEMDYSKTLFSQGIVCFNKNSHQYCVVINGSFGEEDDRGALVMEFTGERGFMIHTPPNRALIPTGRVVLLKHLAKAMQMNVMIDDA